MTPEQIEILCALHGVYTEKCFVRGAHTGWRIRKVPAQSVYISSKADLARWLKAIRDIEELYSSASEYSTAYQSEEWNKP